MIGFRQDSVLETTAGIRSQTLPGRVQVPAFVVETTLQLHGFVTQPHNLYICLPECVPLSGAGTRLASYHIRRSGEFHH